MQGKDMGSKHHQNQEMKMKPTTLLLMGGIHFILMFVLMYAMVDTLANIYPNLNQAYMAGIMTAPMLMLEIALMHRMYQNKRVLTVILGSSIVVLALFFFFIRTQTAIGDKEFLKSMIPHHGGAILMCKNAPIQDSEIKALCQSIIASQQSEIDQMKRILNRLEKP
jgi:hypothetical protein